MARVTGSHLICKALKLEGVKNIFALAGDHILPILDVMADQDFRIIDTRHEQAAVHMADAWNRITEQPGVCMYTTPGFANAIPGLAHAMRLAFSGRRGPVHLTIPIDIQELGVDENEVVFTQPDAYRPKASLLTDPELVRQAIALLRQAQRPLVIAGSAAGYTLSGDALQRFIETTRLPVLTEEQSRGSISDDHPYVFGFFERGLNRAAAKVRDADVVVLLGRKQDFTI